MPEQNAALLQNQDTSLFIGLQSYTEAQSDNFYGRDEETDRLTNLVKANTLTIVFGKSGTGKTSLLNAGVFPRLRKDYCLPFRIRLEFNEDSPNLVMQIKNILKSEIDKYGFKAESYPLNETLWEYFHKEQLWKSVTPILIFDQFEEIFTLAKKSTRFESKELNDFWEELADLIENSIPEKLKEKFLNEKEQIDYSYNNQKIKILFSFREEFLPEFENITSKIPSIKYSRFRLMPMNGNQAYDVITKTWKNNIDAVEAHKIVGFFTNEKDKNKSYDVMEIEPSLLSQVCSYIDKERIIEGGNKISSEFLNKYPKEIILHSIYDEVLAEGNNAIKNNAQGVNSSKPLNEFVEDKLITDEGYRTKYGLNEVDNNLVPGIEVLKRKYFLRDDGNTIELSHDVLAPLIKDDRAHRRKEIALATARAKAKKRAVKIVSGSLIFSILAAGAIWFFTTKKALKDKAEAEKETVIIKQNIEKDSIKLDSVKKRINLLSVDKHDTSKVSALLKENILLDSTISNMNQKMKELTAQLIANKNSSDSMNNALHQNGEALTKLQQAKHDDSVASENRYTDLNTKYTQLNTSNTQLTVGNTQLIASNAQLTSNYNSLKNDLDKAKNDDAALQNKYDKLNGDYDVLNKNYNELKSSKATVPVQDVQKSSQSDDNSLRLNLYSSKNENIPDNLTIYLIPDIAANKKIIKDSKVYEKHCDEANLEKAQGWKAATFENDVYSFDDVAPGDYFIKICSYYGGYYTVTKKSVGNETTKKLDIAPPVN
jgi:ABC-type phosphate transport system ATPase subunit